ncbi:hypothetical protein QE152_g21598 [Popillia japonica]|uniref:Uncharacterized protein n=1 Tax=Popillia japonica TaxID=7064 RepID=A0AAW1KNX6_POPJA
MYVRNARVIKHFGQVTSSGRALDLKIWVESKWTIGFGDRWEGPGGRVGYCVAVCNSVRRGQFNKSERTHIDVDLVMEIRNAYATLSVEDNSTNRSVHTSTSTW